MSKNDPKFPLSYQHSFAKNLTYRLQFLTLFTTAKLFMHMKEVEFIIRTASIPCKGVHAGLSTEDTGLGTDRSDAGLRTDDAIAPFLAAVPFSRNLRSIDLREQKCLTTCLLIFTAHNLVTLHEICTGRERLIRSHSSARFCFELSENSN